MLPTDINHLTIVAWDRPLTGIPISMASNEALRLLTPRLGPTSMLFLHRFARQPGTAELTTYEQLASELGVSARQMVKTLERIVRFGYARWADSTCEIIEVATHLGTAPPTDGGTPTAARSAQLRAA